MCMYTILPLKKITPNDFSYIGRKVSSLVSILGIARVPTGFVITKTMFEQYLEEMGLTTKIKLLLAQLDFSDTEKVQNIANEIQRTIVTRVLPESMRMEILDYYHTLNMDEHIPISELLGHDDEPYVAVRSSPVYDNPSDDSSQRYSCRQHMNFLNICGEERLFKAIQTCWASLFTAQALFERSQHNITNASMAVFVQRMIDAERSCSVQSTSVTNPDEIHVDGCYGLGEVLAAKLIQPDEYIIKKDSVKGTYELIKVVVQRQDFKLLRDDQQKKTVKVDIPEPDCTHQKLSEQQVIAVAQLAKKIESVHGPSSIECSLRGDDVYVLGVHPLM